MTQQQIAILNSLVTYAAENIPGGLSEDEREVAKIAGDWAFREKELRVKYIPIFVGWTKDEEKKIVVYQNADNHSEFHIRRPDGMLWAMGEGATLETHFEPGENYFHMRVASHAWTGEAVGSRRALIIEEPLRLL